MKWLLLLSLASVSFTWAEQRPEELLAAGKKAMDGKVLKVSAVVLGDKNLRIGGIISGKDFDLTVTGPDTRMRQIVKGENAWMSDDDGQTWKPIKLVDRRFFSLVRAPINCREGERIPSFEKLEVTEEQGESLLHVRLTGQEPVAFEGDRPNAWLVMKDGAAVGVRRYAGPLVIDNGYVPSQVAYATPKDAVGVLEPPGNPDAVPPEDPADLLLQAAQVRMETGVWEVSATISGPNTVKVHGLFCGNDFDLAFEAKSGSGVRQIRVQDRAWLSKDGGKTWKINANDDALMYNLVHAPLLRRQLHPDFEDAGMENHQGEKWEHLRLKSAEKLELKKDNVNYWLNIGADGKPAGIRHFEGYTRVQDEIPLCKIDYRPSKAKSISPPATKK
jgi:hypothetical protein